MQPEELNYYSRQILLKELGIAGQRKLASSKALVIGAGGLGSPALLYLAASGFGEIVVCDSDKLEIDNLHRQIIFDHSDIGKSKAAQATKRLEALNPFIKCTTINARVSESNIDKLIVAADIVLDCSDNFNTKFLIHDRCALFAKTLVQSSIYQFEGQLLSFLPGSGAGCLRCMWPEEPPADCVGSCVTAGVIGPVAGIFGCLQVMEAIKIVCGMPGNLASDMLLLDLNNYESSRLKRPRKSDCPVCAIKNAQPIIENKTSTDMVINLSDFEMSIEDLKSSQNWKLIDLRDTCSELPQILKQFNSISMPFPSLDYTSFDLSEKQKILLVCSKGIRSLFVAKMLRELGLENVFSLKGGI
jgi:sulfur-carrier protein adenylyltransferase/sulfurtransferase